MRGMERSRIIIVRLVVILLILIPGMSLLSDQAIIGVTEPVLSDNLDGNWTAIWSLDNPNNYTFTNISVFEGSATLKLLKIYTSEKLVEKFGNGESENLKVLGNIGIGLNLQLNAITLIADSTNNRVLEIN